MEANTRTLSRIFEHPISYRIPLFQRTYVWTPDNELGTLWEDIEELLNRQETEGSVRPHFLGAIVLDQLENSTGSIETREVIDGQQRLTTLQLVLVASRTLACELGLTRDRDRLSGLVENPESRQEQLQDRYKVWPTNKDRAPFQIAFDASGPDQAYEQWESGDPPYILSAYDYLYSQLREWVVGTRDEEIEPVDASHRMEVLWQVLLHGLQIVVIDLGRDDEAQVIFETLNARGTQLLPGDLIKNYLFHRAQSEGCDVEKLYWEYWEPFDRQYWRKEVTQGRLQRPRLDLFFQHYLTLQLRDQVRATHLFARFKSLAERPPTSENRVTPVPATVTENITELTRFRSHYQALEEPPSSSPLATFMERLKVLDTTTVIPLILLARERLLPSNPDEFHRVLALVESFLFRRLVALLTSKNYNRLTLDAVQHLDRVGTVSAAAIAEFFAQLDGPAGRFPDDEEFHQAMIETPLYAKLAQKRVRLILTALDASLDDAKTEDIHYPSGLTIEHVLPEKWQDNWAIPETEQKDPEQRSAFIEERDRLKHTLGNLTLITSPLNSGVSNGDWQTKKAELLRFSRMNLTRYFHDIPDWNESRIRERSQALFEVARQVWPPLSAFK